MGFDLPVTLADLRGESVVNLQLLLQDEQQLVLPSALQTLRHLLAESLEGTWQNE